MIKKMDKQQALQQQPSENAGIMGVDINKEVLGKYVDMGIQMMYSDEVGDKLQDILEPNKPIESAAKGGVFLLTAIDRKAAESGIMLDDFTRLDAANILLGEMLNYGEETGELPKLTEDHKAAVFSVATEKYIKEKIDRGEIDKEAMGKSIGQGIKDMSPEQQTELDRNMRKVHKAATGQAPDPQPQPDQTFEQQESMLGRA